MKCVIENCQCTAKVRDYFFDDEPLCYEHYCGYLEFLVESFNVKVTAETAESSFEKYKIELKPLPAPQPKPKPKKQSSSAFKMKM